MLYTETAFRLRDGRTLNVRSAAKEDAAAMLTYMARMIGETDFITRSPEDAPMQLEKEEAFLQTCLDHPLMLMLTALDGETIVGCCSVAPVHDRQKTRHRAMLGISVLRDYASQGLGRFLMAEVLRMAEQAGYMQMELGVYADNALALHLYKSLGFVGYGRLPRAFQAKDGSLHDEILMIKDLSHTPLPMALDAVVLDARDILPLRDFYAALLGWQNGYTDLESVAQVVSPCGGAKILIQKNTLYAPPVWPEEEGAQQQQAHIDIEVHSQSEMQTAIQRAKNLGAREPSHQYGLIDGSYSWYTLLDPAGHPFCFVIWP